MLPLELGVQAEADGAAAQGAGRADGDRGVPGVEFELTVAVIVWLAVVKVTVWSAEVAVL
jgi:hypothetical protein